MELSTPPIVSQQEWEAARQSARARFPDRLERLGAIPGWGLNQSDAKWERGFRRLAAYAEENGEKCPTRNYVDDDASDSDSGAPLSERHIAKGSLNPHAQNG